MSASRTAVMSILLYGAAPFAFSQDAPKVFSSRSEVVVVHVTVTDGKLRPVAGPATGGVRGLRRRAPRERHLLSTTKTTRSPSGSCWTAAVACNGSVTL